jgi:hypothetical protein
MIRNQTWRASHTLVCLVVSAICGVLTSQAATAARPSVGRGFAFVYDPAKEITLVGTVRGFVSPPTLVSPPGLHLLISSKGRVVDAHLGPYLSDEDRYGLQAGQLVQVIGVNESVHGTNVLLARQLIFNGRLVTVRNERGFLVRNHGVSRKIRDSAFELKNGETK